MRNERWFNLHMKEAVARGLSREEYYETSSRLRRTAHILHLRYQSAEIDRGNPSQIHIPAVEDILPEKFQ